MTYKQWETSLLKYLNKLSNNEKAEIVGYYREMYNDKRDTGVPEQEIIRSFGDPLIAATKILKENGEYASRLDEAPQGAPEKNEKTSRKPAPVLNKEENEEKKKSKISVPRIIGWFFIILLVGIPLAAIMIGVIVACGAIAIAGAAMVIAGAVAAVASPFMLLLEYSFPAVLVMLGASLVTSGLGALIFVLFYYITKYVVVACIKVIKHFARRDK